MRRFVLLPLLFLCASAGLADEPKPLPPVEARKKVGETITVEMKVQTAKDRLETRGEIYLDAELDYRDAKNFAVVITKAGAAKLKEAGINDPADHFNGKTIRATGEVKVVQDVPRIEIDDAKQIQVVEKMGDAAPALKRIEQLGGRATLDQTGKTIVRVQLGGRMADDNDLIMLGGLADLVELSLAKTKSTDAGLPSLARLKKLEALHLADNPITDKGVAALKDMSQLQLLGLKGLPALERYLLADGRHAFARAVQFQGVDGICVLVLQVPYA